MGGLVILGIFILLVIVANIVEYIKERKIRGDLTGKYVHKKSPKGNVLYVEVKFNNKKYFREATTKEIHILKQLNFLK